MDAQLFVTHARMEDSHWWFLARRRILNAVLEACVPPGKGRRAVDGAIHSGGEAGAAAHHSLDNAVNAHLNRPGRVLHVVG